MTRTVEADENGSIRLAGEWTGAKPHAIYIVESEGDQVVLRPAKSGPFVSKWRDMTPEQRAEDFKKWISQQEPSDVHLTDEQLRRAMTPEQRAEDFLRWANRPRPAAPRHLTDEELRRENMYE
jgi:hypothetical protein